MPITLVTGPANAGKALVVLDAVRAHAARGETPLLVVPTETDQARYRRELAESGLTLGVRVERFKGLMGEILTRAGETTVPFGPLARELLLGRIADARPGMARALARLVADLQTQRVSPARLRGALEAWRAGEEAPSGGRATLEWACGAFDEYTRTLARMRRADRESRETKALDALRRTPALWGATPVLLYGFDDLTAVQLDAIETLGVIVGTQLTVSLAYEPGRAVFAGRAATFQRLAPLAQTHTELRARAEYYAPDSRAALHHLERSLLDDDPTRVEPAGAVRLLEADSPRAELRSIASEVRELLDSGIHAQEIAIVHRAPETVAGLLGEVLDDFQIPYAMREPVVLAHTAIGRALLGLLRCATGEGEIGDLLAWLRAPGVLDHPALADRLEAQMRRLGAVDAERARELWEAENWPLQRIDRVREAAAQGAIPLTQALVTELQWLFCAPRRGAAALLEAGELAEAHALAGARRALEELGELARLAPDSAPTPELLVGALERLELAGGEHQGSGRVAIVDPLSLRARRVRVLFVCGLQEGVFPAPGLVHPLLGEDDRRRLAESSGLVLRAEPDPLEAERYLLYALVSRPQERLTLSWHTAGEDGSPAVRSLFVEDVCDLFTDSLRDGVVREQSIESRASGLPSSPIAPLRDGLVLEDLRARSVWSASSLESWSGCPVKWFVERLLRGREIEPDPEPIARGALAHAALKQTLERLRERTGSARLTPASVGLAKRLLGDALTELEPQHPLSMAPERRPGVRRRLELDLERYLECAAEQASPLEPTHLELEFGFEDSDLPPLDIGEDLRLRGRIDRIDVGTEGEAIVYDYKGRSASPAAKWVAEGAWQVGLYMRVAEHLLDRAPAGGFYQPLAGKDLRPRGALDLDGGVDLDCVRTDRLDHDELGELIEQCVSAAREAAGQARSGALEPRPATCGYGGGCAYPTICRCER